MGDMGKRIVRPHRRLRPPETGVSGFGSFMTYGADLDGDGAREMIVGGRGSLYTIFSGSSNRTGARRWFRVAEPTAKPPVASVVSQRTVALLGNLSIPTDLPLLWLSWARSRVSTPPVTDDAPTTQRHAASPKAGDMADAAASLVAIAAATALLRRKLNGRHADPSEAGG